MERTGWPGQRGVGKWLMIGKRDNPCRRVVGVVSDGHVMGRIERRTMQFYIPLAQNIASGAPMRTLTVRVDPRLRATIVNLLRSDFIERLHGVSSRITALESVLEPALRPWRLSAMLLSVLGVVALIISAFGVYSVIAYSFS